MNTFVISTPGRDAVTERTLGAIARQNPGEPWTFFSTRTRGGIADYWALLRFAALESEDALVLEDDVVTARNFLAYVARWRGRYVTSFFFMCGGGIVPFVPDPPQRFGYSQAMWFPADVLKKIAAMDPPTDVAGWDNALGIVLARMGESVVYHRSLVQHTGDVSLHQPGRTLAGRTAPDFVGEDFDCLSLL